MDLVGLKHDDEAARVEGLHGMLDLIELLVGAGAEHDIPRVAAVAAAPLQDRGAAVGYPVDLGTGGSAVIGDDHGQHRGGEAEHHLVDDGGDKEIEHDTVDDGVYIAEHGTGEDDDGQRRRKGDVAERQIRVAGFDSHCDEVEAACAGVVHVDQCIADAADHTGADRGQQAVALIDRQQRQHIVGGDGKEYHAVDAAQEESAPKQLVGAQDDRNVDQHIAQAHRHAEQAVQDGADARNAGDRDTGRNGKAVDACRGDQAAECLQQEIQGFVFRHGTNLFSLTKKPGANNAAPG